MAPDLVCNESLARNEIRRCEDTITGSIGVYDAGEIPNTSDLSSDQLWE